ncbi:Inositol hexakisphosphate kinase 3 [Exaiptasia diaphana]|nr:Inositol hexakisphosphate kinase 3 [Exaiptasia diaphana]
MDEPMCLTESLVSNSEVSTSEETVLETFSHQVGGRSLILTYNRNTVCKPLNPQELRFYLDLPESLRPFTPHYKGVLKVAVQIDDAGKLKLTSSETPTACNGKIRINNVLKDDENLSKGGNLHNGDGSLHSEGSINPWTFHCENLLYESLKESVNNNKPIDFMLMEDLVHNYVSPCIMDLKMGNTMHDSYTNEEKYERQKAKVSASTSKTLGLRIAGIQIYNQDLKKYIYQNKYFGFELNDQSFKEELSKFVHNGNQLRKHVVVSFLEKLQELYKCLEKQDKLRFFSSSLLLIYEGHHNELCENTSSNASNYSQRNGQDEMAAVKMIDFARSFHYTQMIPIGADESYLLGLRNLIKMFQEILLEEETHNHNSFSRVKESM